MRRSHALRAAVTATVIELVIVAGMANQWSSRAILRDPRFNQQAPLRVVRDAVQSLSWRFTPHRGATDAWLGAWIGDAVLVVLTFLVVYLVVAGMRRPAPFFASWLAGWALVLLSGVVGAIVGVVIAYPDLQLPASASGRRFWDALSYGPTPSVVVFGLASGLVAGFGAAIAARTAGALPAPEPLTPEPERDDDVLPPPPWYGEPGYGEPAYGERGDLATPYPSTGEATQTLPRAPEEHATQRLGRQQDTARLPATEAATRAERSE